MYKILQLLVNMIMFLALFMHRSDSLTKNVVKKMQLILVFSFRKINQACHPQPNSLAHSLELSPGVPPGWKSSAGAGGLLAPSSDACGLVQLPPA